MTATPDRLDLPARRRRHARLISALNALIGACAEAAGAVFQPIAAAPPDQEAVQVALLPCIQVSLSAAPLLDLARAEDDARWPAMVAREREEARRTYAARCAVARAEDLLEEPGPPGVVPLPTAEQGAAMSLVSAGDEFLTLWRRDPEEAIVLLRDLVASGEFVKDEVLDEAVDLAVVTGLLALQEAHTAPDASMAAELCLNAVPHIVLALALASADLE